MIGSKFCVKRTGTSMDRGNKSLFAVSRSHDQDGYHAMPIYEKKQSWGVPTMSDTNWAVQLQKMAEGFKFRI